MAIIRGKVLILVGLLAVASAIYPELAWAAGQPTEPDLQAMLEQHAAQCRQFGCKPLELWRGWVKPVLVIGLALALVFSGIIQRLTAWLELRLRRKWAVNLGLAAFFAAAWVAVPTALALLSGESPRSSGVVISGRYKNAQGKWVEAIQTPPSFADRLLDWLGDFYLPTFLAALVALVILSFLLPRVGKRGLAALLAVLAVGHGLFEDLNRKDSSQVLPQGPLRTRVEAMAKPLGYPVDVVRVGHWFGDRSVSMHNANARSFPYPRIMIANSLISEKISSYQNKVPLAAATDRQIAAIIGHELAHLELRHHVKLLLLLILVSLTIGFGLSTVALGRLERMAGKQAATLIGTAIALPLLVAIYLVTTSLAQIVVLSVSKQYEREADARGVEISGDPEGFAQVIVVVNTGRDMAPPSFVNAMLNTHPPALERIEAAMARAKPVR